MRTKSWTRKGTNMYTESQREKAIRLYIKYGLRAAPVIKELGYPNRHSLKNWYNSFMENNEEIIISHSRKPKYTETQRKEAVDFYLNHGKSISFTVKSLGYPCRSVLSDWILEDVKDHKPSVLKGENPVQYTEEEKKEAALDAAIRDESMAKISEKTKASATSLYNWKKKYISDELDHLIQNDRQNNNNDDEIDKLKEEILSLKKDIYRLKMEKDILEKAVELIKKDQGIDINALTNREKAIIINALRNHYPLKTLLKILSMSKSSYYYQQSIKDKYIDIRTKIKEIFQSSYQSYGYRRIKKALENDGIIISEKVVRRLMKETGLAVLAVKRKKFCSYMGEISPAVPNIIKRNFKADRPNEKLLTDITEFHIKNDKVYLSPMIDCFDGYVKSWTIGLSPNASLVNTMLKDTIAKLHENEKPIIHSDRGAHYRWPEWIRLMEENSLIRSMSKKGCSPDNSACEGFFGRLKNEFYYHRDWRNTSVEDFIKQLNDYIIWYNSKRIKSSLGYKSPIDYRRSLGLEY